MNVSNEHTDLHTTCTLLTKKSEYVHSLRSEF